jgi:hypothetical protein
MKCLPEADLNYLRSCVTDVSRQSKWVSDVEKDDKELFPSICCVYRMGQSCLDQITDKCDASPINPRQHWHRVLDGLMKNIEQIACSRYDRQFCQSNNYFGRLSKVTYQGNSKEFLILPVLRIAQRFTDDAN